MITAFYTNYNIFQTLKEARKEVEKNCAEISLISIEIDNNTKQFVANYFVLMEAYNPQSEKMEIINTLKEAKIKLFKQIKK